MREQNNTTHTLTQLSHLVWKDSSAITYCLVGLVVRRLPREQKIPGSNPTCAKIFLESSHTSDLALQWLPRQAPGVIGSVLGLVGAVSVYCDWVRWKFWFATSLSMWQHIKLSEQIHPWDTLARCWDAKQLTNRQLSLSAVKTAFILITSTTSNWWRSDLSSDLWRLLIFFI